jgi:hypothetical protein
MHIDSISDSRKAADGMTIDTHARGTRHTVRRWLSPVYFGLAALAFLLPFATVSCDDATTTFTGLQLVTHTVPAGGRVNEVDCSADLSACVEHRGSTTAGIALAAALIGLLLGLLGIGRGAGWCAAIGFLAMAILPFESDMANVNARSGYLLALLSLLAACGLQMIRRFRRPVPAPGPPDVVGLHDDDGVAATPLNRPLARPRS